MKLSLILIKVKILILIGVAVRIDKFSDSSIDMYVRCFTKTNSWNEMLVS